jgi:hypothetical protein
MSPLRALRFLACGPLLLASAAHATEPMFELCPAATEAKLFATDDGWILRPFDLREEHPFPEAGRPGTARMLAALQARGITVAVVVLPRRGFARPDAAEIAAGRGEQYDPDKALASYREVLAWFEQRGVVTVDLGSLFLEHAGQEQLFFPRDHHWTQPAAKLAADALAQALVPYRQGLREARFETVSLEGEPRSWPGSITTQVAGMCPGFTVPDHTQPRLRSERLDPQQLGLLDEVPVPEVVVVGTSNSSYEYHFSGYLQDAISAEVLTKFIGGSGPLTSMMAYLRSDTYIQSPPRILVWEWIITDLTVRRDVTPDMPEPHAWNQILPSVYGPCEAPLLAGSASLTEGVVPLLQAAPGAEPAVGELYLHLAVGSPSLKGFGIVSHHADGSEQQVEVTHFGRVEYTGHVYSLLPASEAGLERLELVLPAGVSGEVQAQVCRVPGS